MELQTISYKDWYLNQKRVPDIKSSEYEDFFAFHKTLSLDGFMMEGQFFNPFLYWHLNIWNTEVDMIDAEGRISQKYRNPYLRDNEWIITNEIYQANIQKKGLAIGGIRRLAKDLLNSSLLYTPTGTIEIGSAKVGQQIYDRNGKLTTITEVCPQGIRPVYKVSLEDGRELFCGLDHNWIVIERAQRKIPKTRKGISYNREVVKTIRQLIDSGIKRPRISNSYKDGITRNVEEAKYWIPNNSPVEYQEKNLKIDPYFLGLWLGDGTKRTTAITTMDQEIVNYIHSYAKSLGLKVRTEDIKGPSNKAKTYHTTTGVRGGVVKHTNILLNNFKYYNLISNKHIPLDYKLSSYNQRLALLQGLMDSDGSCFTNSGTLEFTNTNKKLFEDFYSLIRSLGINATKSKSRAKLYGKDCGDVWGATLFTELPVFRLERKLKFIQKGNKGKQSRINKTGISKIEYVFDAETTCIIVDNKGHDFLTDDYTITHNSVLESSYIAWGATFDENSQNVISGLNAPDIKLITDKIDKGLNYLPEAWKWQRIEDNWKNQVTLGIKTKDGTRMPFSSILIRNLDDGNNEEAIAGTKPRKLIIDEGGKGSFLKGLQAAIPGFTTPFGWGCSPIVTFTGGDMLKFFDAKNLMFDTEAYNFMSYRNEDDDRRFHGLFMSNQYRLEAKEESTLGKFLNSPKDSELHQIQMQVSNPIKAEEVLQKNLENLSKSGDKIPYLKEKMYYPRKVDDIFLNESSNIYNIEAARAQQIRIKTNEITGQSIELYHDGEQIVHKSSDKQIITEFPVKSQSKDAPIQIWEHPITNPPFGLYCVGVDPYRQGKAKYSDSLGAVYVFKRMHDIQSEKYQDMFVASYVARPDRKEIWEEQARLLIKYYNGRTLCENDDISFIEYMKAKGDEHYLERQPEWLKEIVPNTTVNRDYGVHRSSEKIRDHLHNCLKKHSEKVIFKEVDAEGSTTKEKIGMSTINDPMLLEEMINYNDSDNFDREIAASLALGLAAHLDPIIGKIGGEVDSRIKELFSKHTNKSKLFNLQQSSYKPMRKLFKR